MTSDTVYSLFQERTLIDQVTPQFEVCEQSLSKRAYAGFDPTADSLHLGNYQGIVALRWLQRLGWTPIALIGGMTGAIGDPSGKSCERSMQSSAQIDFNAKRIGELLAQLLAPTGDLPTPIILDNRDWLGDFNLASFLREVGKYFRVNAMIAKQSVRQRLADGEGISYTEFTYQLLQAYDFYHLHRQFGVSLQIGGSDQWGNITAGCEFVRKVCGQSVHGLTWPLLLQADGRKFGKSESGAIWLSADKLSPFHFYQQLVGTPDSDIPSLMRRLTMLDLGEVASCARDLKEAKKAPQVQRRFAAELTRDVHGKLGLKSALAATAAVHSASSDGSQALEGDLFSALGDLPKRHLARGDVLGARLVDVLEMCALLPSRAQGRRLIQAGGVYLNRSKVDDPQRRIESGDLLRDRLLHLSIGKKKRLVLFLESPS